MGYEIAKLMNCFWCGEAKGIALEKSKNRKQHKDWCDAPMAIVADYEPCDKCQKEWDTGFVIIEAVEEQPEDGRPPLQESKEGNAYPTGHFWVIKEETGRDIFDIAENAPSVVMLSPEVAKNIGLYEASKEK